MQTVLKICKCSLSKKYIVPIKQLLLLQKYYLRTQFTQYACSVNKYLGRLSIFNGFLCAYSEELSTLDEIYNIITWRCRCCKCWYNILLGNWLSSVMRFNLIKDFLFLYENESNYFKLVARLNLSSLDMLMQE